MRVSSDPYESLEIYEELVPLYWSKLERAEDARRVLSEAIAVVAEEVEQALGIDRARGAADPHHEPTRAHWTRSTR